MFYSNERVKVEVCCYGKFGDLGDFMYRIEKLNYSTPVKYVGNISINGEYSEVFLSGSKCWGIKLEKSVSEMQNDILKESCMLNKWHSIQGVVYMAINLDVLKDVYCPYCGESLVKED